ncbi:MAG: PQQ-dependent sugar dehydrogenase, partial [Acidobacteriota bacterium]
MLLSTTPSIPRIAGSILAAASLAAFAIAPPAAAQPPADLMLETVVSGLSQPVAIRNAGDGTDRLFIVEQGGLIKILENDAVLPTPFIDLTTPVVSGGEQGLLGLAFHPDYATNGYFYVNYTRSGTPLDQTVVERYQVSAGNPDVADPASGFEIIVIDQTFSNHNGGDIHFNPIDGYLYIGMG